MTNEQAPRRAFAVWFKDLHRWSVQSFFAVDWQWPSEFIKPLSVALTRKQEVVERFRSDVEDLPLVTIRFDGSMEPRAIRGTGGFKGALFHAHAGDVVYSKIDVRNGAIGVVPETMPHAVVSNEFPVYQVDADIAEPQFITLLFRTPAFRRTINGMISGASGRKRVQPEHLEKIAVPLPPLPIQRAIVEYWRTAQAEIRLLVDHFTFNEVALADQVLETLGIPPQARQELPKAFALLWEDLERWSVSYLIRSHSGLADLARTPYPVKRLGEIAQVSYGLQKSPLNRPDKDAKPYLRVANVQRGQLNLSEIKYLNVPEEEMKFFRLQKHDLLVCEGNSADLVGRPAIWNDEIPDCVHQNHILKVRLNQELALPYFVLEFMQTQPARSYFRAHAKFTTNLASINSNDLRELPIPLPPLDVQREIVARVQAARAEVAAGRAAAAARAAAVKAAVEGMILGTVPPP